MAIDLQAQWFRGLAELRYAATPKRLRARLEGRTVLDTRDALLVYEPRRIVPWYAVPPGDLRLELTEQEPATVPELRSPVLGPYRHDNPDLGGRVVMHWEPFTWLEEDEPVMGHPHDPFKRIDVLRSSRHVRVEVGGVTVAESSRPMMLIETTLPVRWYLPREDVRTDLLHASEQHTVCAYKGVASYLSAADDADVAWFYPDPLHDAVPVKDLICFWAPAEVYVDGEPVDTSMPGR
jgi:uncharacterized protein (DUF427 family)